MGLLLASFTATAQWISIDSPATGAIFDIQFVTQDLGFCVGADGVMKTADNGLTWSLLSDSPAGKCLHFIDESNGFVTAQTNQLYKTSDAGGSWQVIRDFSDETPECVFFSSADVGFVTTTLYDPPGGSYIYKTVDGGDNWTRTLTDPEGVAQHAIAFSNDNTGFVVGHSGFLLTTNDAGANWSLQWIWPLSNLFDVCFTSPTTAFAVGYASFPGSDVTRTTDGGINWESIYTDGETDIALKGITFYDENIGYAVGDGGRFIFTNDAGNTWHTASVDSDADLYATWITSGGTGLIVGEEGTILRSGNLITSLQSNLIHDEILVQPNPADRSLSIESTAMKIEAVEIIDCQGKVLMRLEDHFQTIDISDLRSGIYFCKISDGFKWVSRKFTKL